MSNPASFHRIREFQRLVEELESDPNAEAKVRAVLSNVSTCEDTPKNLLIALANLVISYRLGELQDEASMN